MHPESEKQAPAWAIVEIMGHRVIAGRISEVSRFGASFCRVEVDLPDGTIAAQEYSGSAIFCITPSDEATVRRRQASGTYAGPLAIDPPATVALMERRRLVASDIADRLAPRMVDDPDDDDPSDDTHCENCSRTTGYPAEEGWDGSQHDEGSRIWFCPECAGVEPVVCEGANCSKRASDPEREGWERGEHDGVALWFCPEHSRPVDPNAPTCPECGQPLSPCGECENFPACPKSPLPF